MPVTDQRKKLDPNRMNMNCKENETLQYNIIRDKFSDDTSLENFQRFYLEMKYIGKPFKSQYTKLYILYKGLNNNIVFNGTKLIDSDFTSIDLPFNAYYKT